MQTEFRTLLLGIFSFFCFVPAVFAEEPGLDFIILVDVSHSQVIDESGSNLRTVIREHASNAEAGKWDTLTAGSDPQRIRWRAIQLLVDMLDANDRVLIQRFNHSCPANPDCMLNEGAPTEELVFSTVLGTDPEADLLDEGKDFPNQLWSCDKAHRDPLNECLNRFNKPVQDAPFLDHGGTDICEALAVAFKAIERRTESRRPVRILLLSDGADSRFREAGETLLTGSTGQWSLDIERLQELMTEEWSQKRGGGGAVRFPQILDDNLQLHTIGLNLKYGEQAQGFLEQLAVNGNGKYHAAEKATELIELYRNLIRDIKGLWERSEALHPGASISVGATKDLRSLRFLAYRQPNNATTISKPELRRTTSSWDATDFPLQYASGHRLIRRQQVDPLYDYFFCGPTEAAGGANDELSPFAKLDRNDSPFLEVTSIDRVPVNTLQFKDVGQLFPDWRIATKSENTVSRGDLFRLPVALPIESSFDLRGFEFECQLTEVGPDGEVRLQPQVLQIPGSSPVIHLEELLATTWAQNLDRRTFRLEAKAVGVKTADGTSHALTGFYRMLEPLTINVRNRLSLEFSPDALQLTRSVTSSEFPIGWNSADADPQVQVPVQVNVTLPQRLPKDDTESSENMLLPVLSVIDPLRPQARANIALENLVGNFSLSPGTSRGVLELSRNQLPSGKVRYAPGSIEFEALLPGLPSSPKSIPLNLALDLFPIKIVKVDKLQNERPIKISQGTSIAYRVELDDPKNPADIDCLLTLNPPPTEQALERHGDDKDIWLVDSSGRIHEFGIGGANENWTVPWKLNEPFRLEIKSNRFESSEDGRDRIYDASLIATGENLAASNRIELKFSQAPRQFKISSDLRDELSATPGSSISVPIKIHLENCGSEEKHTLRLRESSIDFVQSDGTEIKLAVEGITQWMLKGASKEEAIIKLRVPRVSGFPEGKAVSGKFAGQLEFEVVPPPTSNSDRTKESKTPGRVFVINEFPQVEVLIDWLVLQSRSSEGADWTDLQPAYWKQTETCELPVYRIASKVFLKNGRAVTQIQAVRELDHSAVLLVTLANASLLEFENTHAGRITATQKQPFWVLEIPERSTIKHLFKLDEARPNYGVYQGETRVSSPNQDLPGAFLSIESRYLKPPEVR
ncbi:MAG: hypothetical protein R3C18_08395 [Planctomycetaceae bacterium]